MDERLECQELIFVVFDTHNGYIVIHKVFSRSGVIG